MDQRVLDLFVEACEAQTPLQLEIRSSLKQHRTVCTLDQPYALVGREGEVDLCLPHSDVSRRHAYLQVLGGRVFCVDLMSRSGIMWPEERRTSGWMLSGQTLALGPYGLRLARAEPEPIATRVDYPSPLQTHPADEDHLPAVTLELLGGTTNPAPWPMNRQLALVGRADVCRVQLYSSTVSAIHCALLRTRLGLWVIDLKGRDGVRINGTHLHYARLGSGDVIEVGRFQIRVLYPSSEPLRLELQERSAPDSRSYLADSTWAGTLPPLHDSQIMPVSLEPAPRASMVRVPPRIEPAATAELVTSPPSTEPTTLVPPMMAIAEQFGQMQQQMFDQFQQAMMMMVQFFGTLHRDQMQVIRDELAQIRELTAKLTTLQVELAKHPKPATGNRPAAPATTAGRPSRPSSPSRATRETSLGQQRLSATPTASAAGNGSSGKSTPAPPPGAAQPATAGATSHRPPPGAESEQDVHAWLSAQIEMIQKERQTRWEKVLTFFTRQ